MTVLLGYLAMSTNVRCYYRVVYDNFVFQQDSAPGASCVKHSPSVAVQNSQIPFSGAKAHQQSDSSMVRRNSDVLGHSVHW